MKKSLFISGALIASLLVNIPRIESHPLGSIGTVVVAAGIISLAYGASTCTWGAKMWFNSEKDAVERQVRKKGAGEYLFPISIALILCGCLGIASGDYIIKRSGVACTKAYTLSTALGLIGFVGSGGHEFLMNGTFPRILRPYFE